MPARDGTGPMGMGPMSGGGRGWCNPHHAGIRSPIGGYPTFAFWWRYSLQIWNVAFESLLSGGAELFPVVSLAAAGA